MKTTWTWNEESSQVWFESKDQDLMPDKFTEHIDYLNTLLDDFLKRDYKLYALGILMGYEEPINNPSLKLELAVSKILSVFIPETTADLFDLCSFYENELVGVGAVWVEQILSMIDHREIFLHQYKGGDVLWGILNHLHYKLTQYNEMLNEIRLLKEQFPQLTANLEQKDETN